MSNTWPKCEQDKSLYRRGWTQECIRLRTAAFRPGCFCLVPASWRSQPGARFLFYTRSLYGTRIRTTD